MLIAYSTSARASSSVTIAVSIAVNGPLALYSHKTAMVEAGSVAEQIAAKTTATAKAVCQSEKYHIAKKVSAPTVRKAATPSKSRMMGTCFRNLRKISRDRKSV